jgi:hypothetical protein
MNLNINKITENKVVSEEGKKIGGGGTAVLQRTNITY